MKANPTGYLWSKYECFLMWLSRYGLLENFNASVTRTRMRTGTRTGTGTWTTGVTAIALCTSSSRAKNDEKGLKRNNPNFIKLISEVGNKEKHTFTQE